MYKITLKNIKSINYLEFSFPDKNGVYLLTGGNGCGKTTLLIALNRLGDNLAFSKNLKQVLQDLTLLEMHKLYIALNMILLFIIELVSDGYQLLEVKVI